MVTIHTDGACSGNPGPGGFAAIIQWAQDAELTVTGGDPKTTNNRMELSAVIEALKAVNSIPELRENPVTIRSDSTYVTNAFNKNWLSNWMKHGWRNSKKQPVPNRVLWEALLAEIQGHNCTWVWVRGHSGDPMNERCDRLAVQQAEFARSQNGYWSSAGNPRTEATTEHQDTLAKTASQPAPTRQHQSQPTKEAQDALERNEIAVKALQDALYLQLSGKHQDATAHVQEALRHLEEQRKILTGEDMPF